MNQLLSTIASLLLITAPATAQQLRMFGEVVPSPTGFELAVSGVPVQATGIDLSLFAEDVSQMVAVDVGNAGSPLLDIQTIEDSDDKVTLRGDANIGGVARVRVESDRGRSYYIVLSFRQGLLPLDSLLPGLASGTLWLDPARFALWSAGPLVGHWDEPISIPNDPNLVGLSVFFQGAILPDQPPFVYLNHVQLTFEL